jgi:pimeloyl-ACP methyl ester carboxylesterase
MPGCGESASLPGPTGEIADFVAIMLDLCARVGLNQPLVYGIGFGSTVAIDFANTRPCRVSGLIVRSVLLPDAEQASQMRQHFAPEITLEKDGSHWYRTWQMLRDSQIYWPWYDTRHQSQRGVRGDFDAERLHAWTFDLMKQPFAHRQIIHAALRYDAGAALAQVTVPLLICSDPSAPLSAYDESLLVLWPRYVQLKTSDDVEHVDAIFEKLGPLNT